MRFLKRRILKNFSEVHTVKKASSPHGGYVFRWIKISRTTFEKGNTRNNLVKLFQVLTSGFGDFFKNFFMSVVQKGHTRDNLVKLFHIMTSGFGDFFRISSCPYSAKSLPPPHGGHVFRRIKISRTIFEKGHPKNNPVEFFRNRKSGFRGEDFQRIP